MPDTAISVEHISKKFHLGMTQAGSFREMMENLRDSKAKEKDEFWALRDVNFTVKQGEVVGIIGKNGAGKSTLLKILSRITPPTEGKITYTGRIASLLEVGTGFHPELSGRENIYLNGTILGMRRSEISVKLDEIIEFSGIEKFIDTPVKRYSSGMYVRLAFAVAAHLDPEILIIDEVLAVGDADFQRKCLGKMKDVSAKEGRTVLFVSHNMAAVNTLCQRGILLIDGSVHLDAPVQEVTHIYSTLSIGKQSSPEIDLSLYKRERGVMDVSFSKIQFNHLIYQPDNEFVADIYLQARTPGKYVGVDIGFHIVDEYDNQIYHVSNVFIDRPFMPFMENTPYTIRIQELRLRPGTYKIWMWLSVNGVEQDYISEGISIEVSAGNAYNAMSNATISGCVQPRFEMLINQENILSRNPVHTIR
jgi:lipopolysaccharide transport system ATP-binding protein